MEDFTHTVYSDLYDELDEWEEEVMEKRGSALTEHGLALDLPNEVLLFRDKFISYIKQSKDYQLDEFVGDRYFNLEMAKRLARTNNAMVAKGAYGLYTSNSIMSQAMSELGLIATTDILASDLEICCAVAASKLDEGFIAQAVQVVIEFAIEKTGYNEHWFEEMGNKISKREHNRHNKTKNGVQLVIDFSKEPVGYLNGLLQSHGFVMPNYEFLEVNGDWRCKTTMFSVEFIALSSTKVSAKKAVANKILIAIKHSPEILRH